MLHVMIVEDDPPTSSLLSRIVKRTWAQVSISVHTDTQSALEHWRDTGADLILLDWGLPGMSGIELLRHIHRARRKVACVMITGYSDRDKILAARAHQIDAYIVKPFDAKQVMETLSRIMETHGAKDEPQQGKNLSLHDFVAGELSDTDLGLPIDRDLAKSIGGIRDLNPDQRIEVLRRCQTNPSLLLRMISLANSSHYIHGAETVETFETALRRIGLGGFVNLAVELSLYPGSHLKEECLLDKQHDLQRQSLSLIGILTKLKDHVEFDFAACRNACLLYRASDLCLLQLMQAWVDDGNHLDADECTRIMTDLGRTASEGLRRHWTLPGAMRERIEAIDTVPAGVVRRDQIIMHIAGLTHGGGPSQELPKLLQRLGLDANVIDGG